MKIVQVNTHNRGGGAARAAYQLHLGLLDLGVDSEFYCLYRTEPSPTVRAYTLDTDNPGRVLAAANRREMLNDKWSEVTLAPYCELFSPDWDIRGEEIAEQLADADLINLHWVSRFIDIPWIVRFARKARIPLVWTLHDMNPFTGGCHYNWGCEGFLDACGACPQLTSEDPYDWSRTILAAKAAAFAEAVDDDLTIVSPSRWLGDVAHLSAAMRHLPVEVIPNSIDEAVLLPRDRAAARRLLGIDEDAKVLMFIAQSLANPRKGMATLLDALRHHVGSDVTLLTVGAMGDHLDDVPLKMVRLGHLTDDSRLANAYSAADAMVIPSLQDNLPNTVIEALACGTGVIGSDTGGIPDMVVPGETGVLFKMGSAEALGAAINRAFADVAALRAMGANGRRHVERRFAGRVQASAYRELYERILRRRAAP